MKNSILLSLVAFFVLGVLSCKKDSVDPNEEELITTLRVKLKDKADDVITIFEFKDLDGEGGAAPSKFDEILLLKGKAYDCTLEVLNESVSPAENITTEIIAEANDHQFYFTPSGNLVAVTNLNNDTRGLPLGVTSTWTASNVSGTGTINITLKHKPGAKAAGDAVSVGETDISLDFKLKIQ